MMLSPFESNGQTDTLICDNGGFEDGFLYWEGFHAMYRGGGNSCNPHLTNGNPSPWILDTLPAYRRFEIVTNGVDPLVGIQRTKFGNKALLINNQYGNKYDCQYEGDANKIVKRFKVTQENLKISIWFAVVLEQPQGHYDNQPFFLNQMRFGKQ